MKFKLVNNSRMDSGVLTAVINKAMRLVGAKGPTIVFVSAGHNGGGNFIQCHMLHKSYVYKTVREGWLPVNWGYVKITPCCIYSDMHHNAIRTFETFLHEFKHLRDAQKGEVFGQYNRRWKNRPQERRAIRKTEHILRKYGGRADIQLILHNLNRELQKIPYGGRKWACNHDFAHVPRTEYVPEAEIKYGGTVMAAMEVEIQHR